LVREQIAKDKQDKLNKAKATDASTNAAPTTVSAATNAVPTK